MARRPILITGGTGFVGSAVVRRLLEPGVARDIRVLSRHALPDWMTASGVRHIPADLSRLSTVDTVDIGDAGTVLHLAVHIGSDPVQCEAVNVDGTRALLDAARRAGTGRFIQLSTCAVYGNGVHRGVTEFDLAPAPVSPTSRTRLAAEHLVRAAGGTVLRPNLVYGPGDVWVVPTVVRLLAAVPAWADGGAARLSMIAVDDLARALVALATAPRAPEPGSVFHANHPVPVSMRELVTALGDTLGIPLPAKDLSRAEHQALTARALPALTGHQYSLLADDHYYDSGRLWAWCGIDPGPGLAPRLAAAAPWYRDHLLAAKEASHA